MSDCSYCITKQATGKIDSPSVEENVEKARALVHAGATEIRITGQDTGVYGWDRNQGTSLLPDLLERICTEIDGEFRVRVGMANPKGLHGVREELAQVFADHDELYNFIHAPVQSGSDDVLADMRRQHNVSEYLEVVDAFDDALDYWTLSTDFIVGFPTEEPEDHDASMELMRETRPEKINVTRFSKRPGTDAADMKGLGGQTKKDRSKPMSELKMELTGEAYEEMVGQRSSVLLVEDGTEESLVGYDEAYRQVVIVDAEERGLEVGDFVDVEITSHSTVYAFGEAIENAPLAE